MLHKIKEKGLLGCISVCKKHLATHINSFLFYLCRIFPVNNYKIIFESEGDFSDNAQALYQYMKDNGYFEKYKPIWFADNYKALKNRENVVTLNKSDQKISLARSYHLATCKFYIYDHCNYLIRLRKRSMQQVIYLCHGYAGFKAPKGSYGKHLTPADEVYVTGTLPQKGALDYLQVPIDKTFILGFSRLDWFYADLTRQKELLDERYHFSDFDKVILWMPTFRKCDSTAISEDYLNDGTGLPLLTTNEKLNEFNDFLNKMNIFVVLKVHHLQAEMDVFSKSFSNILIIHDEQLAEMNIQLYQFIPCTDGLISDYSSISTDYYLLNRPVIFVLDDYEEYNKSRGIYPENAIELMKGYHVYNIEQLQSAINEISEGKDIYRSQRNSILKEFHEYQDGQASKRIVEHLGIQK